MSLALERVAFADGHYRFALTLKLIIEIERNCGVKDKDGLLHPKSIYLMHDQLGAGLALAEDEPAYFGGGAAFPSDIREIVRCGLIGGASGLVAGEEIEVGPMKALQLCDDYLFPNRPLVEAQYIAWAILDECIRGVSLKKKAEEEQESSPDSIAESSSPTADSSDSIGEPSPSENTSKPSKRTTRPSKTSQPEPPSASPT